jgi:hypothetical protein
VAALLADLISVGVLTSTVPRDAVDDAVAICGRDAKRSGGALPPRVMVYFAMAMAMAMALFADDDYEGVFEHLPRRWCLGVVGRTSGRRRRPVATPETRGGFAAGRRLVSIDSMLCDLPDRRGRWCPTRRTVAPPASRQS